MTLDSALICFHHGNGAAEAFTAARDRSAAKSPWLREIAFVERHRHHDHLRVTGTIVGHYIDLDENRDPSEHGAAAGFAGGAVLGMLFGPTGLVAGAVAGGLIGAREGTPDEPSAQLAADAPQLVDQLRASVPKGGSAVVLIGPAADVDAMLAAFDGSEGEAVRQTLRDEQVAALKESLAATPAASLGPSREGEVAVEDSSESG